MGSKVDCNINATWKYKWIFLYGLFQMRSPSSRNRIKPRYSHRRYRAEPLRHDELIAQARTDELPEEVNRLTRLINFYQTMIGMVNMIVWMATNNQDISDQQHRDLELFAMRLSNHLLEANQQFQLELQSRQ